MLDKHYFSNSALHLIIKCHNKFAAHIHVDRLAEKEEDERKLKKKIEKENTHTHQQKAEKKTMKKEGKSKQRIELLDDQMKSRMPFQTSQTEQLTDTQGVCGL